MEIFDVIIVGGGPAGLQCAKELARSDLRVLLLEKREVFGDKLCAGGLTLKDMKLLPVPDHVIQQKISRAAIHSRNRSADTVTPVPYLFTVNRQELGAYQRSLLEETEVVVRTHSQVTEIGDNRLVLKNGQVYGFRYLVGADGYASIVRRHLGLKVRKRLIGFQYTLPVTEEHPELEMFLDTRRFHLWYAWIFPHGDTIAVGCCCDPDKVDPQKVKEGFHDWLKETGIETRNASLESYPIAYDYQGYKFANIFLVGEAAGLASGFTGEGIYQSLVSGQEVARLILDPAYKPDHMIQVLKYNRTLARMMALFRWAGPMRGALQEFMVFLMTRNWIRDKINSAFS
ncbi:MAG: geranylgeranyl reductase family protein [Bacteroidales bacterium]|nr:geranylgeranyl reductase family protein [Bacteroidales bacterium]